MPCVGAGGRQAAGEPDHRALGRGVRGVVRQPEDPGRRGHHDAAVALLDHVRPRGAGGVERPADVDREVPRQVVLVDVGHARPAHDAGVVHQDVDAAELLDRGVDERLRALRRGHVAGVGDRRRRRRRRSRRRPRRAGPASAPSRPSSAPRSLTTTLAPALGEQARVGPTDAAPGAGDDRDAPVEAVLAHGSSAPLRPAPGPRTPADRPACRRPWPCARRRGRRPSATPAAPGCRGTCPRRGGSRCPT